MDHLQQQQPQQQQHISLQTSSPAVHSHSPTQPTEESQRHDNYQGVAVGHIYDNHMKVGHRQDMGSGLMPPNSQHSGRASLSSQQFVHVISLSSDLADESGGGFNLEINTDDEQTASHPSVPDGGWGWMVVLGSFVTMLLIDGICLSYGLFLAALETTFGDVPKLQMMFGGSLITGCYLIMGPVASALSNQYGFRAPVLCGSVLSSVSIFLSSFMSNITGFILLFGLGGGMGYSLIFLPSSTIIALWFERYRATATGIAICGSGVGVCIFSTLIPVLIEWYSWRGCLMILAALNAHTFAAGLLFRPLPPRPLPRLTVVSAAAVTAPSTTVGGFEETEIERMITDYAKQSVHWEQNNLDTKDEKSDQQHQQHVIDMVLEKKKTDRAKSLGSLNSMLIMTDNRLVPQTRQASTSAIPGEQLMQAYVIEKIVRNYIRRKESRAATRLHRSMFHLPGTVTATHAGPSSDRRSNRNSLIFSQISMPTVRHHGDRSGSAIFLSSLSLRQSGRLLGGTGVQGSGSTTDIFAQKISQKVSEELSRPLLRPDFFYPGSTQHLNNENIRFPSTNQYAVQNDILDAPNNDPGASATTQALRKLFDVSILRYRPVQLNLLVNLVGMAGFLVPFQFLVSYSDSLGYDDRWSAALLTVFGVCSTIGRILTGAIADCKWANCLVIHNICLIVAGVACMLLPFMKQYALLVLFVVVYAFSTAAFVSLKTIVIVDVLGTEKLTNIFGWTTLAMGISIIFGPPLLGSFYDLMNSYTFTFLIGGGLLATSGLLSVPLRFLARRSEFKQCLDYNVPSHNNVPLLRVNDSDFAMSRQSINYSV